MILAQGKFKRKQIVSQEAMQQAFTPHTIISSADSRINSYGLGWFIDQAEGRRVVRHGGDFDKGISTIAYFVPNDQWGIVILTNAFPEGHILHDALTRTFMDLVYKGRSETDWWSVSKKKIEEATVGSILDPFEHLPAPPKDKEPGSTLALYVGEYQNDYYGEIRVTRRAGQLVFFLGQNPEPLALRHWNADIFEEPETNTGVYFHMGNQGAYEVLVKSLDFNGRDGRFRRVSED